jgi:hypothetical protein
MTQQPSAISVKDCIRCIRERLDSASRSVSSRNPRSFLEHDRAFWKP